ncbi:sigma-70 family RNA polymerase sigma factor [Streptomyces sp. NPDC046465]|uniref:RNA polymerase sigma factor n=1 Tax=Streptomyces sp. NPDC046465 TaxID=3155810 RepID=UPI0033DE0A19
MADSEAVTAEELAAVFARHRSEMTGKARQLLAAAEVPPSVSDADDVVSTAFTRALRDPAAIREPRAYLFEVIRTEVAHLVRRRAEHRRLEERRAADPLRCDAPASADFSALVDNRDVVHRAVRGLSAQQRTAVWATKALDCSRDEVAVLMDVRPGTVAAHVSRAVKLLRAGIAAATTTVLTSVVHLVAGVLRRPEPAGAPGQGPDADAASRWSTAPLTVVLVVLLAAGAVVGLARLGSWALPRRRWPAVCPECRQALGVATSPGRPPRYCSAACRAAADRRPQEDNVLRAWRAAAVSPAVPATTGRAMLAVRRARLQGAHLLLTASDEAWQTLRARQRDFRAPLAELMGGEVTIGRGGAGPSAEREASGTSLSTLRSDGTTEFRNAVTGEYLGETHAYGPYAPESRPYDPYL